MPVAVFSTPTASGHVNDSSPFGPFTLTVWPDTVAVTPDGTGTGFLPMRDIVSSYLYFRLSGRQNMLHRISPPTFSSRARESDITPLGVDRIDTPRPLATLVRSRTAEYTRRPGLETRLISRMA